MLITVHINSIVRIIRHILALLYSKIRQTRVNADYGAPIAMLYVSYLKQKAFCAI